GRSCPHAVSSPRTWHLTAWWRAIRPGTSAHAFPRRRSPFCWKHAGGTGRWRPSPNTRPFSWAAPPPKLPRWRAPCAEWTENPGTGPSGLACVIDAQLTVVVLECFDQRPHSRRKRGAASHQDKGRLGKIGQPVVSGHEPVRDE